MTLRPLFHGMAPGGTRGRLSILIFHRVHARQDPLSPGEPDVQRFDQMLTWIGRWLQVLPLDEAIRRLQERSLPPRAAAITFDDGYADNATQALPVLQRHAMPATFFIATGFLDAGVMWNDTIIESVRQAPAGAYDLRPWCLDTIVLSHAASRIAAIGHLLETFKYLEPVDRSTAVAEVHRRFGSFAIPPLMMSSEQVLRLKNSGMQIGAHTCTHPILARTSEAVARSEIVGSKQALERLLGEAVTLFAYPNGKPGQDYLQRDVALARDAGFIGAVSTRPGVSSGATDPFQLPRFTPWDRTRLRYGARMLLNLRKPGPLAGSLV